LVAAFAGGPVTAAGAQVKVGERELALARADASHAAHLLGEVWEDLLPGSGRPRLVAYRDSQPSACGMLGSENAFYCVHDDAIYYDEWFIAAVRTMVSEALETDGDRAAFAILAHEWGHRIYARLRPSGGKIPLFAEGAADCLGGAALRKAGSAAAATVVDTAEAMLAIRLLGDEPDAHARRATDLRGTGPPPGDPAARGRFQRRLVRHGDSDDRARSFRRGLRHGAGKCMKELRRAS
jgi:hypothetical protein